MSTDIQVPVRIKTLNGEIKQASAAVGDTVRDALNKARKAYDHQNIDLDTSSFFFRTISGGGRMSPRSPYDLLDSNNFDMHTDTLYAAEDAEGEILLYKTEKPEFSLLLHYYSPSENYRNGL
mmetsp:Transcript_8672/g.24936  ORF Transcript_8672/g.24936 Transcript_8672/m.24936 type:complete len:122 (+) Transcript_8672:122-487(+)